MIIYFGGSYKGELNEKHAIFFETARFIPQMQNLLGSP